MMMAKWALTSSPRKRRESALLQRVKDRLTGVRVPAGFIDLDGERYSLACAKLLEQPGAVFLGREILRTVIENPDGYRRKVVYNPRLHVGVKPTVELHEYVRLPADRAGGRLFPEVHLVVNGVDRGSIGFQLAESCLRRIGFEESPNDEQPNRAA